MTSYLLDSNVIIRWLNNLRLSKKALSAIQSRQNRLIISSISLYEIEYKKSLGKLNTKGDYNLMMEEYGIDNLTFTNQHALTAAALPYHHGDPFDRMLIAQAMAEDATMITTDQRIELYNISVLDA